MDPGLVPRVDCDRPGPTGDYLEVGGDMKHYSAWFTATWFLLGQRVGEIESASIRRLRGAERGAFYLLSRLNEPK